MASVRHHVTVQASGEMPEALQRRGVAGVSAIVYTLMTDPDALEMRVASLARQAQFDEAGALRAARRVQEQMQERS